MNPIDPLPKDSPKTASFVTSSASEKSALSIDEQLNALREQMQASKIKFESLLLRQRQEQQALQRPEDISDKILHAATSTSTTTPTTTNISGKVGVA